MRPNIAIGALVEDAATIRTLFLHFELQHSMLLTLAARNEISSGLSR